MSSQVSQSVMSSHFIRTLFRDCYGLGHTGRHCSMWDCISDLLHVMLIVIQLVSVQNRVINIEKNIEQSNKSLNVLYDKYTSIRTQPPKYKGLSNSETGATYLISFYKKQPKTILCVCTSLLYLENSTNDNRDN